MTREDFNELVDAELDHVKNILCEKNKEYAEERDDPFHNFNRAAGLQGETPHKALFGMLAKHLVSIETMCEGQNNYPPEQWTEKITDTICYMLLLLGIIEDDYERRPVNGD